MIDKKYNELVNKILTEGKLRGDRTGTGTISIFNAQIEHNMSDGFPLLTGKKMYVGGIIHELLWFLNGDTNIQYLVRNGVNIWTPDAYREYKKQMEYLGDEVLSIDEFKESVIYNDKFAEIYGELGPIYGKQWVKWGGQMGDQNQIQNAIDKLNNNPDSRRIMVSALNVGEIYQMVLPPCHWAFELYTEELTEDERGQMFRSKAMGPKLGFDIVDGKPVPPKKTKSEHYDEYNVPKRRLHLKWHQRSVDTFLGLPFNIASYGFLLHMFAQQTNMIPGTLIGDLTNVHIYSNHIEQCEEQLRRTAKPLPLLKLIKADDMFSYEFEHYEFVNYDPHPTIKGTISV